MRDLPPLQWLRSFEASARHLSFTHAAAELSMTQSAISQQIKALENFLGHPLFIRKTRSLELTDAGFAYLPDIQSALAVLRRSTRAYFGEENKQSITIRSNFAFSTLWLTPHLDEFLNLYPDVSIHIVPALWESDYRQKSEDIEIRFGTGNWTDQSQVLAKNMPCYPVCSPDLAQPIKTAEDLAKLPQISVSGMMQQWSDYFQGIGLNSIPTSSALTTPSFNIALEMACKNMGVVLSHDLLSKKYLDEGKLVRCWEYDLIMEEKYYIVYEEDRLTEAELTFCNWLLGNFHDSGGTNQKMPHPN